MQLAFRASLPSYSFSRSNLLTRFFELRTFLIGLAIAVLCLGAATLPAQAGSFSGATNFGSVPVNTATPASLTLTFTFTTGGRINAPAVVTQGAPNLDFTDAGAGTCTTNGTSHVYAAGNICTVDVNFSPKGVGPRYGAVELLDSSGNQFAFAYVQGTGTGPVMTFANTTSGNYYAARKRFFLNGNGRAAEDASGNVFFADGSTTVKELIAVNGAIPASPTIKSLGIGTAYQGSVAVAVDGVGNIFVACRFGLVKEIVAAGGGGYSKVESLGGGFGFGSVIDVAVDGGGNLFIADWGNKALYEIPAAGGYATVKTLASGDFRTVAIDRDGNVYAAAYGEVKEILVAGGYTTIETLFKLPTLSSAALDAAGNLYVSSGYDDVSEVSIESGYTAIRLLDGGFNFYSGPNGAMVDSSGNVIVNDYTGLWELDFADPPSLSFASTAAGDTSTDSPQKVTVQNVGNKPLSLSAVSYPADFSEVSGIADACAPTDLAAGSSCQLTIDFSPLLSSATGATTVLNEQVSLTDNNLNGSNVTQQVAVNGTETHLVPPALTAPSGPGKLSGPTTFTWDPGAGSTRFHLTVGSMGIGSYDIYNGPGVANTVTSATATIPSNGVTVFVRLAYLVNGAWSYIDYTFTEAGTASPPALISPSDGTLLNGSTSFAWSPGTGSAAFSLSVGTSWPGSSDLYPTTVLPNSVTSQSATVPSSGGTVFVRLGYLFNGVWNYLDYTFREVGAASPPALTAPGPGSLLGGATTFTWTPGSGSSRFQLTVGSEGAGSYDIYNGPGVANTATSASVTIPANGVAVFVRLSYLVNGIWKYLDYAFTEAGTSSLPALNGPPWGTLLKGATTFTWNPGKGVPLLSLKVGTGGPGALNLYDGPVVPNPTTSATVTIPANGELVNVRLSFMLNGVWQHVDHFFMEAAN